MDLYIHTESTRSYSSSELSGSKREVLSFLELFVIKVVGRGSIDNQEFVIVTRNILTSHIFVIMTMNIHTGQ